MKDTAQLERHAARLARCYPRQWRSRYADEFTQLLIDELADGQRSVHGELNVIAHGLWTRLAYAGLAGAVVEPRLRTRARFVVLGGVSAAFVMLAAGVWSQPAVGWQWSAPASGTTKLGVSMMSAAIFGLGALLMLLAVSLCGVLLHRLRHQSGPRVWSLALVFLLAVAMLWLGSEHFAAHWPGTGGHAWSGRGLVPGWLARLVWAATLWITSYWAHPGALTSFPAGEVVWMLVSPLAWLILLCSVVAMLHQVTLTGRRAQCAALTSAAAVGMMITFLAGAAVWISSDTSGPGNLFAVGTIDFVILAVLAGGLTAATHLVWQLISGAFTPAASWLE